MIKYLIIGIFLFTSCTTQVIDKNNFKVIDTLDVKKNGLGFVMGYDVVIKYKDRYHYGYMTKDGSLTEVSFKELKYCSQ